MRCVVLVPAARICEKYRLQCDGSIVLNIVSIINLDMLKILFKKISQIRSNQIKY